MIIKVWLIASSIWCGIPALAQQMGESARTLVEQDYNVTALAPRLLAIISDFSRKGRKSISSQTEAGPKTGSTRMAPRAE